MSPKHLPPLIVVAILALAGGVLAANQKKKPFEVGSVKIEGNEAFSEDRLQGLMVTRPSGFLSTKRYHSEVFHDDLDNLLKFYHQNGYLEAALEDTTIARDSAQQKVSITIRLTEGPLTKVEGITIFDNRFFSDSTLRAMVKLQIGGPLRRPLIEDAVSSMLSAYAENGFLDASVTPDVKINSAAHLATVDFVVRERAQMSIDSIRVTGLEKTNRHVVMRELKFHRGEIIRYSRLLNSQRRLYLTGLFESVFIRPVDTSPPDSTRKDILIEIKEAKTSEFAVSVGYASVEKIRGRIELSTSNLSGTARGAGAAVEANFIKQGANLSFSDPWTLGVPWQTDLRVFGELQQEPAYDAESFGFNVTVGRKVKQHNTISIRYRFQNTNLTKIKVVEELPQTDTRIRSLSFSYTHDSRNDLFNCTRGTYLSWTNEVAGAFLQGSNTFARSVVNAKYFRPVGRESVLATALKIGWMDKFGTTEEVPLNERFYAGGPNTLRGFSYQKVGPVDNQGDPIGGRFQIIWNVFEWRRTIYKIVGGALFLDAGNVWPRVNKVSVGDIRYDAGAGLRVNSPLGIGRLDFGVNLDPRDNEPRTRLFLGMGQAF